MRVRGVATVFWKEYREMVRNRLAYGLAEWQLTLGSLCAFGLTRFQRDRILI